MSRQSYKTLFHNIKTMGCAADSSGGLKNRCICLEFGLVDYNEAWNLQRELIKLKQDHMTEDMFILLEHPPVFTLGRNSARENLKVSESHLETENIPLIRIERGGEITYHGPGQIVGYPVMDLRKARLSVVDFVGRLEEVMIQTVGKWGLQAKTNPLNRGVWINGRKLGSVGIAVRRGISFHGFALNVNADLKPFEWINPCGLEGVKVTSLANETEEKISMLNIRQAVRRQMEAVFNMQLIEIKTDSIAG